MAENAKPVRRVDLKAKLAKDLLISDQQKLNMIHYDDTIVREENNILKSQIKEIKERRKLEHGLLMQSKSLPHINPNLSGVHSPSNQSPTNSKHNSSPQGSSFFNSNYAPAASMTSSQVHPAAQDHHQQSSLPQIKRKPTSYHRKFVNEVRNRDYHTYLDSLHAVNNYKGHISQHQNLKQKLFREKYQQNMSEYKQYSRAYWDLVGQLDSKEKAHGEMARSEVVKEGGVAKKQTESKKSEGEAAKQKNVTGEGAQAPAKTGGSTNVPVKTNTTAGPTQTTSEQKPAVDNDVKPATAAQNPPKDQGGADKDNY